MTNLFITLVVFLIILLYAKTNETAKEFIQAFTKEWMKARTVFTSIFYGAYIYLILHKIAIPPELNTIISTLFGFWFGQKQSAKKEEQK